MKLLAWLREEPQPSALRVDGERVEIGRGGSKWSKTIQTIDALNGTRIEALGADGTVLRATTLEDCDDAPASSGKLQNGVSDVQVFARLIGEAYEKGTKSYAPLLDNAMNFIERQAQRLAAAEREIERLRSHIAKLQLDAVKRAAQTSDGGELGALAPLLAPFVQGMLAQQAQEQEQEQEPQNGAARPGRAPK